MPAQGKKYLSISETAKFLGVSIDTIRRWDKNGTLASVRLDGKNRYFDLDQLKALKSNKPLSISEAAATLGISITTLRRLEARGLIIPSRDANGERLYTKESLDQYVTSRDLKRKEATTPIVIPAQAGIQTKEDSGQARMTESAQAVSGMTAQTSLISPLTSTPISPSPERSLGEGWGEGRIHPRETTNNIVKNEVGYSEKSENQNVRVSDDQNIRKSDSIGSSNSPILRSSDSPTHRFSDSLSTLTSRHSNSPISSFFKPQAFAFMAPRLTRPNFAPAFSRNPMFKMAAGATAALFLISILSYSVVMSSKKETTVKTIVPKMEIAGAQVLASTSKALDGNMKFNIPAVFGAPVRFSDTIEVNGTSLFTEDVTVQDKNLTLGTGAFTAGTSTITGLSTTGSLAVNGASNLNGTLDVEGVATFGNVINFGNLSTDPATGVNGAQYYNTTSNIFRCYVNGTWVNCDTDTTSGGTMSSFNIETNGSNSFSVGNGNTVDFIAGSNVTISTNTSDKSITISAAGSSGGMTSFTLAGDSGTNQTISDASTLTVAGGSAISTVTSATGVVTANLDLFTGAGTTATTSSASGLEISSGALSLLRGCNDTQILSWNSGTQEWACTNGGGSSAIINVEEEGTPVGTNVTTLNFAGADFDLTTPVSSSTVYLQISSAIPRKANNETISGSWTYSSATPITLSNTAPVIAIGATGTLSFTDGSNTLLSIADNGTTGRITTGNATLTALSSGAGTQLCINGSNQIVTCTSGSGGVTGSGTVNQIPKFTTTTNIGDSLLADDGTTLTYAGTGGMSLAGSGAPLTVTDNAWLGLGSSAGKIEFDDQTTDEVNILNANVGIGTSTPIAKLQTAASGNTLEGIFGSTSPVVLQSNWGTVSFNSYNDGSGQKGYTGGGAYAGAIQLRANTGQLSFNMGGAVATAGDAVTMATVMLLSQNGNLMLGPGFADTYRLEVTGAAGTTRAASITGAGAKTAADYGAYIANTSTSSSNSINKYGTYITSTGTWNGTSANNYGLYVDTVSGGTNNYGAVFASGNVGVGDTSPTALFTVGSGDLFQVNSSGAIAAVTGYTQGSGVFSATLTTTNSATFGSTTSGSDIIALKPQTSGTANSFTGTITTGDLTGGNQTFTLPNLGAATSDTVCLLTLANCVGTGGGISGSGTTNTIPKFTSASAIGNSLLTDDGTTFTINTNMFTVTEANGNTAIAGTLDVAGHGAFGNNGSVVSGQVLTVDENSSITSGTIYGTLSAINANAAGSSTANYAGVRGGTNIITAQQYSSVYGVQGAAYALSVSGASVTGNMVGVASDVGGVNGITSGTIANLIGFENASQNVEDLTVTNSYGLYAKLGSVDAGAITNNYGIRVVDGTQGAGTIGTNYGLYINAITTGDSANYGIYVADAGTASLYLASTDGDAASGITFGADTNLYRSGANTLKTDDAFNVNGNFNITSAGTISAATGITSSGTITFSGFSANGGVLYTNGSGVLAQTAAGTSSQCLIGGTTPSFGPCSTGGGITGSGTTNTISKFTSASAIGDSLLTDDATTLTYSGTGGLTLSGSGADLTFANGESINNDTNNQIEMNLGTSGTLLLTGGSTLSTNQTTFNIINATATTVNAFGAATTLNIGAGSGTATIANGTVNLSNGVLQTGGTTRLSNAGALSNITGYSQTSGAFAATLTTTNAATFTSSTANSDSIALKPATGGSNAFTGTLTTGDLTGGNQTFTFPDLTSATSDTVCLLTLANCVGTGGGISGSGTTNTISKFTSASSIGNSLLSDNGTTLTYTGSGGAVLGVASTTSGSVTLYNAGNAFFTKFQNSASQTQDITYTLPVDDGTNNYVLTTNGSGTLSWQSVGGVGGISGSGTTNTIPKFTAATAIGDSLVTDDGTTFAINTNMFTVTEASGNTTVAGTLAVNGAALTTDDTTFALLNGTATTVNAFGAATALNIGASGGLTLTPGGNVTVPLINTKAWTYTSDLSGGARTADVLTISQANDGSNDSTGNLLQLTNSDTGSTAALLNVSQAATTGTGIAFAGSNTGGNFIDLTAVSYTTGTGVYIQPGAITSGYGLRIEGSHGSRTAGFTGKLITTLSQLTYTSTASETGNHLSLSRQTTASGGSTTVTVSGDLASLTSTCLTTSGGTCTDSSNILELTQSYASATGAVLNIVNAGTGNAIEIAGAGTRKINSTSGDLALATTTSGNITLTPSSATALVNVLTGNLKVGNGTPTQTQDGEDAYVEGLLEVDGVIYNDGLTSGTPAGSVCYNSSNAFIQCSGGSGLSGSGTSGQIAFFNGTNSITSETSGFGWDTSNKLFTLTSTATTQSAAAFVANSLTTGNVLSLSSTSTAGGGSGSSYLLNLSRSGTNSNATHTAYGIASAVTNTGTTSTNIAGYFSASGASNNYGIIVPNGGGYVGIGTSAPGALLELDAMTGTGTNAGMIIDADTADNAFIDFYEEGVQSANIFWNGSSNYLAINSLTNDTIISSANLSLVGIGTTNPARKLEINSLTGVNLRLTYADGDGSATNYSDFLMSSSGDLTIDSSGSDTNIAAGDNLNLVSGAGTFNQTFTGTTTDAFNITAASLTTGELMNLNATYAPTDGSTNEAIDINLTHAPTTSADTFAGIDITTGDATALGNTINNVSSVLNLSGNAAKTARGYSAFFTDTSTTADTLVGYFAQGGASGAISTGTRNIYGFSTNINSSAANTGGTTGLFGVYSTPTSTNATTGSTTNIYGGYFAPSAVLTTDGTLTSYGIQIANNATINTTGTTTQFGIDIAAITGADTNIGLRIVDAGTYSLQLASTDGDAASGITFGTDTNLYRSAANMLKTDDNLTIAGLTTGTPTGSVCYDSNNVLIQCSGGSGLSGSGTSGQIAFFNGTNSITSETSGFGWDTTNKLFTVTSTATTQTANSFSGTAFTTGELLDLTGTWATSDGSSNEAIDINLTHAPTGGADNFIGIDLTTTDATTLGNTIGNFSSTITLTGNAAKTPVGYFSNISSNSTTADTFFGYSSVASTTGIITTGTRSYYGYYSAPTAGAESTGGTTNVYGYYAIPSADVGAGGTVNSYGLFVNNGTFDTDGTSAAYGVNIEAITGADTNIGLRIADAGTYSLLLASTDGDVASGITFGSDTNLYRSAANVLSTNASILPTADDTYDLGDNTHRWANLFLGGETLHIGTSTADEAVLSYTTASNTLLLDNTAAGIINIGTTALAQAITLGNNTTTTSLALTSGTGDITLTSTDDIYLTAVDIILGDGTGTVAIASTGLDVSTAGVMSGITGYSQGSGTFSLTAADTSLINLAAVNVSGTGEGLILPQTTSCASGTAEGQICWDTNDNTLWIGDGAAATQIGGSASVTWNGIADPTGNQALTFDDTEISTWTINSDTESVWTMNANSLTTGKILSLAHTTSVIANGGSLLKLSSTSADTGTTTGNLLDLSSSGSTAGSLMNIAASSASQTTTTALAITQSGVTTGYTGNFVNITGSSTTGSGTLLNLTSVATSAGTGLKITANSLTDGTAMSIGSTSTGLAAGSLLSISTGSTSSLSGAAVRITATADFSGHSNGGLLGIFADSTTAGFVENISADAMTTGRALNITSTSTGMTTGSLIFAESATTGAIATNGLVHFDAYGNYTSSSNVGLLQVQANATTGGTIQNIQGNALTTGTALRIASTGTGLTSGSLLAVTSATTNGVSSGIVSLTASGNYTSSSNAGLLNLFANSTAAGTAQGIFVDALTTGVGLSISSLGTGLTSGSLLSLSSATTGAISTGGVSIVASGAFTSSSNTGFVNINANTVATGNVQSIFAPSLTTGKAMYLSSTGTGMTSGSLLFATSGTTGAIATNGAVSFNATGAFTSTSNQGFLSVNANSTTAGTAQSIFTNALTTGVGLYVTNSSSSSITTGSLIRVEAGGTGTVATNGIIQLRHGGNYASTSNMGFVGVQANSTTAGTIMSIDGNALTTGQGLRIASTGTGLTSGSLLFTTTATTGAMATNGAVSFNATGAFTSTSNMGFVNVNASATTAGTVHSIFADALTTGVGLYTSVDGLTTGTGWSLNSTSTAFTSGKLQAIDWSPGSSTTATGDLLSINMGANALGANLLNLYNNGSSIFSVNQTQFTSAVPVNFTAAGDVSLAYDMNFTNATASYITSDAPLYLVAGETFNSSNLILQTYNNGAVVVDSALSLDSQITLTANSTTPSVAGGSHFLTANTTNPTLISNFTNGTDGQIIYIQLGDSVTDLDCTSSSINCGTTDMTNLTSGDVVGLLYNGSKWNLISWMRNSADNSNPTNGVDLAEYFFSNEALTPGDVVSIDQAGTAYVKKSTVQYDNKAMGVIATQPGIILGPQAANTFPVALVGRVPVKVDPNSAPIKKGDFLTASGTSGMAMKAQNPGQMLGRALEDWNPGQPSVLMFVNASYADPNRALANLRFDENGQLIVPTQNLNLPEQFGQEGWGTGSGSLSLDEIDSDIVTGGSGTFANLFANVFNSTNQTVQNALEAGEVVSNTVFNKSKSISVELTDGLKVSSRGLSSEGTAEVRPLLSISKDGEASVSGKLSAPEISASQATIKTLTVKNLIVENLMQNGATGSATIDFAEQGLKADVGEFDLMTINTDLTVAGTATLADVAVMNQMKFNNNLTINETSINTLGTDLEIQPLKQAAVSFMADAVRIETDGTVTFNENVAFKKDVEVAGVLSATTIKGALDDIKVASASAATEVSDTEVEASGSAGMVTLKAGELSVKVNNPKVTEDSLIFITPKGTTYGKTLYIKNQIEGASFTVGVEGTTPAASNIKFNFLIVN